MVLKKKENNENTFETCKSLRNCWSFALVLISLFPEYIATAMSGLTSRYARPIMLAHHQEQYNFAKSLYMPFSS